MCKEKVSSFVNKSNCNMKDINVTNEVLDFECRLLLRSGDIAIFPREVRMPIVPLFAVWDKITHQFCPWAPLDNVD